MVSSELRKRNFALIGAGPVGIFLSYLLIERGHNVTLFEAGGRDSESTSLNLTDYIFKTKSKIPSGVHRVGGASNLWKRRVSEFSSETFNRVDENGEREWPLDFKDLEHANSLLFKLLDSESLRDKDHMEKYCKQLIQGLPEPLQLNLFRFCDEDFFTSLLAKLETNVNFKLVTNTRVMKLQQLDAANSIQPRVGLVLFEENSDSMRTETYSDAVLTGGCLQSTFLAMNSDDLLKRLPAPFLLGKFLMEHFDGYVGTLRIKSKNSALLKQLVLNEDRKLPGKAYGVALTIPNKQSRVSKVTDFHLEIVQWRKTYLFDPNLNIFNGLPTRIYRFFFFCERIMKKLPSEIRKYYFKASDTEIYSVWLKGEEVPFSASQIQIQFSHSGENAKLVYNHKVSKDSKILMRRRLKELAQSLKNNNLGKFKLHSYFNLNALFYTGPNFHPMGSLRMGLDPDNSVVGPDFAFHGTRNIYAVNSGVFPNGSNHNPTAMVLALSVIFASSFDDHV